jgi:hypothetical protein
VQPLPACLLQKLTSPNLFSRSREKRSGQSSCPPPLYRFVVFLRCSSTALADGPTALTAAFNSSRVHPNFCDQSLSS